jgi:serine/threonine protein kinase
VDLQAINYDDYEIIRDEIKIHSCIEGENIIRFYDWLKDGETIYIILEYAEGKTLFDYLNRNHPLSEDFIKKIMRQILNGLQTIHSNRIIHRDLKPENVLLDAHLNAKICDFGWSERIKSRNIR